MTRKNMVILLWYLVKSDTKRDFWLVFDKAGSESLK